MQVFETAKVLFRVSFLKENNLFFDKNCVFFNIFYHILKTAKIALIMFFQNFLALRKNFLFQISAQFMFTRFCRIPSCFFSRSSLDTATFYSADYGFLSSKKWFFHWCGAVMASLEVSLSSFSRSFRALEFGSWRESDEKRRRLGNRREFRAQVICILRNAN